MNEEMEKAMNALSGSGAAGGDAGGDATDWKAKYEEAQRQLQSAKVEQGRVKKLDEENKALRSRLAGAEALKRAKEEVANMGEDQRGEVPEDYLVGAGVLAQKMAAEAIAEQKAEFDRRIAEREQREAAAAQARLFQQIEQEFPGLLRDISEGGDKHAAWLKYQRYNAPSITKAIGENDFDTLAWHFRNFYNTEVGIPPPSGGTGAAAPDPSPTGGGQRVHAETGKIYTAQEYAELEKKAMQLRRMGDYDGYRKMDAELNTILTEGRVKD